MMNKITVYFLIACLWACNQNVKEEVAVSGKLTNYKGDKVYFEICGQDSLIKAPLDSAGCFAATFAVPEGVYVRLMNGKAAFPLYLTPGMKVSIEMDAARVRHGEYESVVFPEGINKETCMMAHYYENQWFPSTQEMFVYPPEYFKQLMDTVVAYNDNLIDACLAAEPGEYNRTFVDLFKIHVKVPLAMSYLYYPVYHTLLNPDDQSEVPADFNIFDKMLPKNDSMVYNKVYRYKTYEVSWWNNRLAEELSELREKPVKFTCAYFDKLVALDLIPQIKDDVANTFILQQIKAATPEVKACIKTRYKDVITDPAHLQRIEKWLEEE